MGGSDISGGLEMNGGPSKQGGWKIPQDGLSGRVEISGGFRNKRGAQK